MSRRVHSRYSRTLADAAIGGRQAVIVLAVRRFLCLAAGCASRTFAEQVDGLTTRYARKTPLLAGVLGRIAVALAGRAGARLACGLGVPASRQVLLRLVMAIPDPAAASPRVVGVDDLRCLFYANSANHPVIEEVILAMSTIQSLETLL